MPDLDQLTAARAHRYLGLLTLRTVVVGLVVLAGLVASGAEASHLSSSRPAGLPNHHVPIANSDSGPAIDLPHGAPSTSTSTGPPTTTTTVPPTTTTTTTSPLAATAPKPVQSASPQSALTSSSSSSVPSTDIQASGTHLVLNGSTYHFVGVNAYEAATDWGTNAGCGADLSDAQLDQLFSSLPPNSLVRFWAFQGSMAINVNTGQIDWAPLDRVFAAAAAYHQRLIAVLTDQGGTCDGDHWQDPSWYGGGFKDVFNDPTTSNGMEQTPLSYWQYLQEIVSRYASSPALGMWEPISEAEASTCAAQFQPYNCSGNQTCPNETVAAQSLRYFFDTVGAEIHALDPDHLVESGLLGSGQCGTQGADYEYVSASPGINVLSYHDYYGPVPFGGDQWNGLGARTSQAMALDKPIIGGEVGIQANPLPGCLALGDRNAAIEAKIQAQEASGSSGILVWNWVPVPQSTCTFDIGPNDPVMQPGGAIG